MLCTAEGSRGEQQLHRHTAEHVFDRPCISRAVLLLCEFLTIFDVIRVISALHRALTQPDGSLSGWLPFACRPAQILLVLHADDHILGIQVLIWWSFGSPCFPVVSTCQASCCPWTGTSRALLATWKLKREKKSTQNKPLLRQKHLNYD